MSLHSITCALRQALPSTFIGREFTFSGRPLWESGQTLSQWSVLREEEVVSVGRIKDKQQTTCNSFLLFTFCYVTLHVCAFFLLYHPLYLQAWEEEETKVPHCRGDVLGGGWRDALTAHSSISVIYDGKVEADSLDGP